MRFEKTFYQYVPCLLEGLVGREYLAGDASGTGKLLISVPEI